MSIRSDIKTLAVLVFSFLAAGSYADNGIEPKSDIDIWDMPEFHAQSGKYEANWESLSRYEVPDWFKDAKFGIWSHWDPQSVPERGDWYARNMYIEGTPAYKHCVANYGHPSEFGYKDLCAMWTCDGWDPNGFMDMVVDAGGKYFVALANHHDNYDCWDSRYQPWNSMNFGPKKDVVGIWEKAARKRGLPFGVSVHATPARTWGQFIPVRFTSDRGGPKKDVPYDAVTATFEDGKGTPWEGLDPKDLYGFKHNKRDDSNKSPFANQFMWRVNDLLKYNPDLLYFDECAGVNWVDLGVKMGLGRLGPQIAANYYNKNIEHNNGRETAVLNLKAIGGVKNSLATAEEAELLSRSLVRDTEKITEGKIEAYPFQTDDSIGPWHIHAGCRYRAADWVIRALVENVSKNGNLLLCITQRAQGEVDPAAKQICEKIGGWLRINGEGIYGSRPFEVFSTATGDVYFTRKNDFVYAFCMEKPENALLRIPDLRKGGATIGNIYKIEALGSGENVEFTQDADRLQITLPAKTPNDIVSVFKIHQDKPWINDDDPNVFYTGWIHKVNRDRGEYNNDVHESYSKGDRCTCKFEGKRIRLVANTGLDMGDLIILIDGDFGEVVRLTDEQSKVQQVVYESDLLGDGEHQIEVIKADNKLSVIDAFEVLVKASL